jgi:hypothetical protein
MHEAIGRGGSIPCGRKAQVFHVKNNLTCDLRWRGVTPDKKEFAIFLSRLMISLENDCRSSLFFNHP